MAYRIGPPFTGAFAELPPAGSGAWGVAKINGSTGQITVQLGGKPPKPTSDKPFAGAGFEIPLKIDTAGSYIFSASVDVGPVTMLPRGFLAHTQLQMGLDIIGDQPPVTFNPPPQGVVGVYYGVQSLAFSMQLSPGTVYLGLAVGAEIDYTGSPNPAPYAEITATYRIAQIGPGVLPKDLPARVKRERMTRELTEEEWAKEGTIIFSSR